MKSYSAEMMLTVKVQARTKTEAQEIIKKTFKIDENSDLSTSNIKILDVKEGK